MSVHHPAEITVFFSPNPMKRRKVKTEFESPKRSKDCLSTADGDEEAFTFLAASFREPYCSLILNGAKTIETRKWPMLAEHQGLLAVHCAYHEWEGADEVRSFATEVFLTHSLHRTPVPHTLDSGGTTSDANLRQT